MPLFGNKPEERTLGIGLRLQRGAVLGDGDEPLGEDRDDLRVAECLPTGGDTVVSGATERVPVHRPEEYRLAGLGCAAARLPDIDLPRDSLPSQLVRMRGDLRGDGAKVGRGTRTHVLLLLLGTGIGGWKRYRAATVPPLPLGASLRDWAVVGATPSGACRMHLARYAGRAKRQPPTGGTDAIDQRRPRS